jgi:DNA-binding transcriptional MerR regulator
MSVRLKIGELAQRAHCQVETVRYDEREGAH